MIVIIDYGVGNLFSLQSSLKYLNIENKISSKVEDLQNASSLILPGVGAFGDASTKLRNSGLDIVIKEEAAKGKNILGICVGMQLLFEKSFEYGIHPGIGLIRGEIVLLQADISKQLKVPHIGWNGLMFNKPDPICKYIKEGDYVYYVHSYYAKGCELNTIASSMYGVPIPGIVKNNSVYGVQFHPEKSGQVGLKLLKAFGEQDK